MSGSFYTYSDSDYEMVDPLQESLSRTPRNSTATSENSTAAAPEPARRTSVNSSPQKPPRPASMAGAQPRNHNGDNRSANSSIQYMDDIHITEPRYSEVPEPYETILIKSDPTEPNITKPQAQPSTKAGPKQSMPAKNDNIQPEFRPSTKSSPTRDRPPQSRTTESRPSLSSSQRSEPVNKEERKRAVLVNKLKAADKHDDDDDDDDYENSFMQRHRRPIMLIVFLLLAAVAIAIVIGAINASLVTFEGAFSKNLGKECSHMCEEENRYSTPPLVVIALNGFQSSFFRHRSLVSNIARLAECGVHGNTLPSYPSTAIPNLYSMVTGIDPAYQGKASDWLRFYGLNETEFGPTNSPDTYSGMDPKWFQLNGLWGIAADQGLLTASHSWIGREGDMDWGRPPSPSYYQTYDSGVDYRNRMQTVLNWLRLDSSERPDFITVYFEDPGVTVHKYGLDSEQTMQSLARADAAIGVLLDSLHKDLNLGCINVLVVSTGGMADKSCDRTYYLSDDLHNVDDFSLLPETVTSFGKITATDRTPLEMDTSDEIMEHLQCKVDHGQVFTKRLLPVHLHSSYGLNDEDTVVLMDEGWTFAKQQEGYDRTNCKGASDGFNPNSPNMQGMFVGFGKSFKTDQTIPAVRNVDLYNLMAELIDVTPKDNNGTAGVFNSVLVTPKTQETVTMEFSSPKNAECSYPGNDDDYNQRQIDSETGCSCTRATLDSYPETSGIIMKDQDENLWQTNVPSSLQRNAPFGFPKILRNVGPTGQEYCELYQSNFITAYENSLKIPLLATFSIQRNAGTVTQIDNCLRYDVRLQPEKTPKCSNYLRNVNPRLPFNMELGLLYEPSLADSVDNELNALTTANVVPMYAAFKQDVWMPLAGKIRQWANQGNRSAEMNVVIGPVYDWNSDTLQDTYLEIAGSQAWVEDTPVPSHYFIVASRCKEDVSLTTCSLQSLEVISFVLPHTNAVKICQSLDDYLSTHMTSLQDVELISGLQLFPDMSTDEDLKMEYLRFRTTMPTMSSWMM